VARPRASGGRGRAPAEPEPRLPDLLAYEQAFWSRGVHIVAGIDEVGRGPLAGPVVAAAVVMPPNCSICGADDSKRLTRKQRDSLDAEIRRAALAVGIGAASAREIDQLNIRRATALAMQRAIGRLGVTPDHLLVDGLPVPELGLEGQTAVVEGDHKVHSIACASIVAKVCRDHLMRRLAQRYPQYGWERNKGYGTAEHRDAMREFGMTPHHRRSFHLSEQLPLAIDIPLE
jgi:ribonuclease HII